MTGERLAFGERLRRHRERRGVSLEAVSQSTKVATTLYAGLERGDCSRWPAGLYSRAYVRAYAGAIGLDPEETVEEFAALFASEPEPGGSTRPAAPVRRGSPTLRLSMVEEPPLAPARVLRRASLAGADAAVALALSWTIFAVLDPGIWVTVASGLAYHGVGRVVTDEPLISWVYHRLRSAAAHEEPPVSSGDDVAVGDAARTTA